MNQSYFLSLEGGEGVGKSTAITFIEQWFSERKIDYVLTREPGGTALAEKVRNLLLTKDQEDWCDTAELLLVFAARAQHLDQVIKPALAQGKVVISDRFTDATYAYQGFGRGLPLKSISLLEAFVQDDTEGRFAPDMTLLLDAPVDVGMARAAARAELDRFEQEKMSFFDKVREGYLWRASQEAERFHIIDATQSIVAVQQQIAQCLEARFERGCR